MKLTILGSLSAYPSHKGFTTSQVLEHNGKSFLIDCGEGTQLQLRKNKIKFNSIEDVFISHLHGDHYFGLPGLILTFNLLGREKPLNIFGPKGIKEIITSLMKVGKTWTNYKLNFLELNSTKPQVILNKNNFTVTTIPLCHGIYTNGFLFRKKITSHKLIVKRAIDSWLKTFRHKSLVPTNPLIKFFYLIFSRSFIPFIGQLFSKDKTAYKYLQKSRPRVH